VMNLLLLFGLGSNRFDPLVISRCGSCLKAGRSEPISGLASNWFRANPVGGRSNRFSANRVLVRCILCCWADMMNNVD
jgi:predicted metal-binding membrane protein